MTNIDKDKLIEVMAKAVRSVNLYGEFDPHERIAGSEKIAEAALKAICKGLPEFDDILGEDELIDIYNQLKAIGK
jgi:hypothetical protein